MKRLSLFFLFIFLLISSAQLEAGVNWNSMNINQRFQATTTILKFLGKRIVGGKIGNVEIKEDIYFLYNEKILYIAVKRHVTEQKMRYLTVNDLNFKKRETFDYIRIKSRIEKNPLGFDIEVVNFKNGKSTAIDKVPKRLVEKGDGFEVVDRKD